MMTQKKYKRTTHIRRLPTFPGIWGALGLAHGPKERNWRSMSSCHCCSFCFCFILKIDFRIFFRSTITTPPPSELAVSRREELKTGLSLKNRQGEVGFHQDHGNSSDSQTTMPLRIPLVTHPGLSFVSRLCFWQAWPPLSWNIRPKRTGSTYSLRAGVPSTGWRPWVVKF